MPWNNPVINGSNSVSSNKTPLNQNSAYIETTMQVDHFWDNGNSNYDGHHDVVESISQSGTPTLSTDMTSAIWAKDIAQTARATNLTELYHRGLFGASTIISQIGLIRAVVVFTGAATIQYSFNVASVTANGSGQYTIVYTNALPSAYYIPLFYSYKSGAKQIGYTQTAPTTAQIVMRNADFNTGTDQNPDIAGVVIFGG